MSKSLPRREKDCEGRGMFYRGQAISLEAAADLYNNLSVEDAAKLTDEEISDLALATQEIAENREF